MSCQKLKIQALSRVAAHLLQFAKTQKLFKYFQTLIYSIIDTSGIQFAKATYDYYGFKIRNFSNVRHH